MIEDLSRREIDAQVHDFSDEKLTVPHSRSAAEPGTERHLRLSAEMSRRGLEVTARAPDSDDPVSATLAGILERISSASTYDDWHRVARDARAAVAALDAALKAADHFASEADRFGKLSETADEESGAALAALVAWQAYDRCAKTFREAITAALAGKEAGDAAANQA